MKQQIVLLYFCGKRKCDIVREYGISSYLLNKWISQFNIEDLNNVNKSSLFINEELFKLRKENQILKKENNILRKVGFYGKNKVISIKIHHLYVR